jgi:hypothetical protein
MGSPDATARDIISAVSGVHTDPFAGVSDYSIHANPLADASGEYQHALSPGDAARTWPIPPMML